MRVGLRSLVSLAVLSLLACGGGSGKGASTGKPGEGGGGDDGNLSIADEASKQGGILGGGRNGYEGSGVSGTFKADKLDKPIKMDGVLAEWEARAAARTVITGSASGTTFSCGIAYDDSKVYFGGEVTTSFGLYRTARFGDGEDHASLVVAFPSAGGLSATEIAFFAGKPGESSGAVRYASGPNKGHDVPGAKIVEAPADHGYSFEASLPWGAFPEARTTRVGLRGAGRYYDAQGSSGIKAVLATSQGDAAHAADLAALPNEAEQSLIENLLTQKGWVATSPKAEAYADVNGDGMKERVAVYDTTLTITGYSYRGGKEFFYRDLGAELVRIDARDVTGRGRDDLLLRRKFGSGTAEREWLEVWSFFTDEPTTTFAHEVAITSGDKQVTNVLRIGKGEIELGYEPAKGWDPTSYREPTNADVSPLILPWGAVKSQSYKFDGKKFTRVREVSQTPTGPVTPGSGGGQGIATIKRDEPATPTVTKNAPMAAGDVAKALIDRYKADHAVAAEARPKVDLEVNVDGDAKPERVVLFGKDIVVTGPGFKNGTAYEFITLSQFSDAADIKDLTARDLTGDGAADLVVRGVRHVTAAGHGTVDLDVMFIYQVRGETITRVFGIETGREQNGKRVQGLVQMIPSSDNKRFEIDVRPGRATGWTEKSYPWAQDQPGSGALEPLLLPWGKIDHLRYAWDGSAFTRSP